MGEHRRSSRSHLRGVSGCGVGSGVFILRAGCRRRSSAGEVCFREAWDVDVDVDVVDG